MRRHAPNTPLWTNFWQKGLTRLMMVGVSLSLFACVEINGKADVDAKGHVKVVTTYDFSKVFNNLKTQNPALGDRVEGFDCKIFVSESPNFKCEDEGVLKYKMSDEMDQPVGVTLDEKTGDLSFDAVKFFAQVTDIKSMVQRNTAQGDLIGPSVGPLLPLQSARRDIYQKEGLSIVLKVQFANDIVSVDDQEVKNKGHEMTINFMDIADKPSYVIVTRPKQAGKGTWWFVVGVLILLALAVWFLWRKNKGSNQPNPPSGNVGPNGSNTPNNPVSPNGSGGATFEDLSVVAVSGAVPAVSSIVDSASVEPTEAVIVDAVSEQDGQVTEVVLVETLGSSDPVAEEPTEENKLTKGQRIAQVISAAAVGMGTTAVGSGAHHSVEELLVQEEPTHTAEAIVHEHELNVAANSNADSNQADKV